MSIKGTRAGVPFCQSVRRLIQQHRPKSKMFVTKGCLLIALFAAVSAELSVVTEISKALATKDELSQLFKYFELSDKEKMNKDLPATGPGNSQIISTYLFAASHQLVS